MSLQDLLREHTVAARDACGSADRRWRELRAARAAAEDKFKRLSTEIASQHLQDRDCKRTVSAREQDALEIREALEALERERTRLNDALMAALARQDDAEKGLRAARGATELAEANLSEARDQANRLDRDIQAANEERLRLMLQKRGSERAALFEYLGSVAARLNHALSGESERSRRVAAQNSLKAARHSDPLVGDLCDQRDQYREFLKMATVPGVRDTVQAALGNIDAELERRFPGAAANVDALEPSPVEDLYYFRESSGSSAVILPIDADTWHAIALGQITPVTTAAARLAWSVIRGARLSPGCSTFAMRDGLCTLSGGIDSASFGSTAIALGGASAIQFRFVPVPTEIQQLVADEDPAS
jgi:hypothetical protein